MAVQISGTTGITTPGLESAAMPTVGGDAVVESGSNSDGEWTRWGDGTQMCYGVLNGTVTTSVLGSLHRDQDVEGTRWDYPVPFVAPPAFIPSAFSSTGWGNCSSGNDVTETYSGRVCFFSISAFTGASLGGQFFAQGRWK